MKKQIYEINDLFSVVGYSLFLMGGLAQFSSLDVAVIPVNSIADVFTGLLNTDATGNIVALVGGIGILLAEKYYKYKRIL